jgi:hypothetical protein
MEQHCIQNGSGQDRFLEMLPAIRRYAAQAFRRFPAGTRDELVHEIAVSTYLAFARLVEQGKVDKAFPSVLARFAIAQVKGGQEAGRPLNKRDILSRYCQLQQGIIVERLDHQDGSGAWRAILVADRRASPAELAASRIDFPAWLATLSRRNRRIAEQLAVGERTGAVARRFHIAASRISQLRREFAVSWHRFHGLDLNGRELEPAQA